jgi:hypothetical protein
MTQNTSEPKKYWTRYGRMTADKVALDLLDRSAERMLFLREVFNDVSTAHIYYCGDDPEPNKDS